jgi:murein DD-endopeptidase MepM/ murein hydrolase activator NlpD
MIAALAGGTVGLTGAGAALSLVLLAGAVSGAAGPGGAPIPAAVPAQWAGLLAQAAQESGVPAAVLAAQLDAESGWDPTARSPAGAHGLAQFMPATWATWGADFDGDGDATAFDPEDAIVAQGRFMGHLLRLATASGYPGDPVDLALAGYNAGWGAVQTHRGVPPYPQTIAYLARIRDLAASRYTLPTPAPGGAVWPVDDPNPITNRFGDRPPGIVYALGYHTGIDLNSGPGASSDLGAPVRAARAGTVLRATTGGPLGLEVVVQHPDGYYSSYGHLGSAVVTPGQAVSAGQPLGTVGCSGMRRCAPHLHLEVRTSAGWQAGSHIDPLLWLGLPLP